MGPSTRRPGGIRSAPGRALARGAAIAVVFALAPATSLGARPFAPWPDGTPAPALERAPVRAPAEARQPESNPVKLPFLAGLWFYRNAISPLDGVRCGLYPTCSGYATHAIRLHGPLFGGFLAADRLIHEASVRPPEYPVIEKFGRRFVHDPVERNDRLFRDGNATPAPAALAARPVPLESSSAARVPPAALADPQAAERFAASLVATGDRYRAVTEYRRASWLALGRSEKLSLLLEAGWVSAAAGAASRRTHPGSWTAGEEAFDEADRLFEDAGRIATRAEDPLAQRRAEYARAMAYLARGYMPEASRRFSAVAGGGGDALAADAAWLAAWSELSNDLAYGRHSGDAARERFGVFAARRAPAGAAGSDSEARVELARSLIAEAEDAGWKRRSPGLAFGMSLVLPGSGYVYAGKPLVGAGAFLLNGAFIAGTVAAVRDENYPLALILLSLETGWYLGGAGGAGGAGVERNEAGRAVLERRLRKRFMGTVWPGGAAAAVLF